MLAEAVGRLASSVSPWLGAPVQLKDGSGTTQLGRGHHFGWMLITWL